MNLQQLTAKREQLKKQIKDTGHSLSLVHELIKINELINVADKKFSDRRYSHHFRAFI